MRKILFRGKTIDTKEWVDGSYVYAHKWNWDGSAGHLICDIYGTTKMQVIPETVGQFTGLTDKNGKKIFEGDIVKIYWKDNVLTKGDIRYDEKLCRFVVCEDFAYPYGFDNTTPFEIIGNIHDNPELLRTSQNDEVRE